MRIRRIALALVIGGLISLAGCQDEPRRLVIEVDQHIFDEIVSLEVFILRVPEGAGTTSDADLATDGDLAPDAGTDASADADTEAYADADAETFADADAETYADADTDGFIDAGIDAAPDGGPGDLVRPETCRELLTRTGELDFPEALVQQTLAVPQEEPVSLGRIGRGRVLVLVRGRDESCRLAQTCRELEIEPGDASEVRIALREFVSPPATCPDEYHCQAGQCQTCGGCCTDVECSDHDPTTTDICAGGECDVAEDLDQDGSPAPADCDDRIWQVHPGAFPACGYNLDHDCDGRVDDMDGCGVPPCWLGEWTEVARYPELRAKAVTPFQGLVAAAIQGGPSGTRFWLGSLDEGRLTEVGSVDLEGFDDRVEPHDLVIYNQTAYILTSYNQFLAVVDLSNPTLPVHLGSIDLGYRRSTQSITLSPPLLWISRLHGPDVLDISQVGPDEGWPEIIWEEVLVRRNTFVNSVFVRGGRGYLLTGGPEIHCFDLDSPASFSLTADVCLTTAAESIRAELRGAHLNAVFVTPEREVVLVSRETDIGGVEVPPALGVVPFDEAGQPIATAIRAAAVEGTPRAVLVAGGTILRSSSRGLTLHPRLSFDTLPDPSVTIDFDEDPTNGGPLVYETILFGNVAVAAVDGVGLVTLELSCAE